MGGAPSRRRKDTMENGLNQPRGSSRRNDTMEIFVRNGLTRPRGSISTLVVKPTDTIYSVMAQMEDITGVPPILQRLDVNGQSLFDYTPGTLADHKIGPLMTLEALHCASGAIRLVDNASKALRITGNEDYSSEDDDAKKEAAAAGKMLMVVADYMILTAGRTVTLAVEAGDTVASVMEQVQRRRRYPVAMQRLICGGKTMLPDGGATLADYNVTKDSKLELRMNRAFAVAADREERRLFKQAKEIADQAKQQQLGGDKCPCGMHTPT